MTRRGSGGRSASFGGRSASFGVRSASRSRPAAQALRDNPPQPVAHASQPAPAQSKKGPSSVMGALGASVVDGMAFGTGSAIAHRAVGAVMGGPHVIVNVKETVTSSGPASEVASNTSSRGGAEACGGQFKALQDCLNNYGSDISKCQFYMDMLQECRRGSGAGLGA